MGKESPNLKRWLAKNKRLWGAPTVYKDKEGVRWIGWIDEGTWFLGNRLWRVLNVGTRADVGCWTFPVSDLTEEDGFWDRYRAIGRCAIDEGHTRDFIGDETRWEVHGDIRKCLWCGNFEQRLRRWDHVVPMEEWGPVEAVS